MGPDGWEARAEGIVWRDGRIVVVGQEADVRREAQRLGLPVQARPGAWILPGFVDAHMHFLHAGVKTARPDLRGAASKKEALARLAAWLHAHPGSRPVIAEGWDESGWPGRQRPTRDEVDAVVSAAAKAGDGSLDRPVVLRRICGHVAVAGSGALPLVRARWDDDAAVNLETGLLLEAPSLYLNEVLPSTPEELDRAILLACAEAHRLGVTALGDYSQAPYRAALRRAASAGALTVRVASSVYVQQLEAEVAAGFRTGRPEPGAAGDWMRDGGLKVFLDGSLGAHTALLREPYLDWKPTGGEGQGGHAGHDHSGERGPGPTGQRIWTDEDVDRFFGACQAAGVQVHAHAIGDGAIDQGLEAFARLAARADLEGKGWQGNALRHRFEHFEIAHDDQVARAAELRLVSSSQPNFVGEWSAKGGMYQERLGARFLLNNRFRAFKRQELAVAFGSDGMPFGPLVGLQSAVAHPDPAQRLEPLEAAWHYTWMAAWSLHWEDLGHLAPGNPADLVVLDPVDPLLPASWTILQTYTGGLPRLPP
jgi:predicted amidohydrolase YtcJ